MPKQLIISNSNETFRVSPERIAYISSDGNYSTIVLINKEENVFTLNLLTFEKLIEEQLKEEARSFIRLGKSLIINRNYIYLINPTKQQLFLSDICFQGKFSLTASKEALKNLKEVLDFSIK